MVPTSSGRSRLFAAAPSCLARSASCLKKERSISASASSGIGLGQVAKG